MQLYEEEKQRAVAKGLAVPPDGLPDPSNVDGDLNYHLELVDLLGMCAKGRNPVTEEYCRRWFSEDDLFRVLSQEGVPVFIKSPFVRMLHGVYFSASASDEAAAAADSMHAAGREDYGASGVMSRYWGQIARLFHSIEQDVTRFRLWVRRSWREKAEAEQAGI